MSKQKFDAAVTMISTANLAVSACLSFIRDNLTNILHELMDEYGVRYFVWEKSGAVSVDGGWNADARDSFRVNVMIILENCGYSKETFTALYHKAILVREVGTLPERIGELAVKMATGSNYEDSKIVGISRSKEPTFYEIKLENGLTICKRLIAG